MDKCEKVNDFAEPWFCNLSLIVFTCKKELIIYYALVIVLDVKLCDGAIYLQGLGGLVTRMLRLQGFFKNLRILKDSPWGRKRHKCIFPR